jgi:hypothetical protein
MIDKANNWMMAGMNRTKQELPQEVCVMPDLMDCRTRSHWKLRKTEAQALLIVVDTISFCLKT